MPKLFLIILTIFLLLPVLCLAQEQELPASSYEKAVILELKEVAQKIVVDGSELDVISDKVITVQQITLKILSGKFKNQEKIIENSISDNLVNLKIGKGDKVIVYLEEIGSNDFRVQIHDYYRLPQLFLLIGLFVVFLLLIGKGKGLRAMISLLLAILLIFKVFIPLLLKGANPIWLALIISLIITIITLVIIAGFKKKTLAAILGTIGGLICATILAITFGNLSRLSGLSSEEARMLVINFPALKFSGLLFAGIIITALGAVMDVAISVASGMAEVKKAQPGISRKDLIKSGIELGRDIMGTMSNTLIFAYVGTSLFVLLLFTEFGESYLKFFNFEFVAEEIIGAIAGSIGLILVIPITAVIAGWLERKK